MDFGDYLDAMRKQVDKETTTTVIRPKRPHPVTDAVVAALAPKTKRKDTRTDRKNHMPVKGWFLTYSQCERSKAELLAHAESLDRDLDDYVICREKHEDGGYHLHAFLKFNLGVRRSEFLCFDFLGQHGQYKPARSWRAVIKYVKKDGDYITKKPINEISLKRSAYNEQLLTEDPQTLIETGALSILQLPLLDKAKAAYRMHTHPARARDGPCGIWIYGEAGLGKTRKAYWMAGGTKYCYRKDLNKWWDNYNHQEWVLIDEMGEDEVKYMRKFLCHWADRYPCTGQIKGGTIPLNHLKLVVTSNWSPKELWPYDPRTVAAIERRFILDHLTEVWTPPYPEQAREAEMEAQMDEPGESLGPLLPPATTPLPPPPGQPLSPTVSPVSPDTVELFQ